MVISQYYGAKKLRLYNAEGHRIELDEEDADEAEALGELDAAENAALEEEHTEYMDVPELDVEEEFGRIIAEDDGEAEEQADE